MKFYLYLEHNAEHYYFLIAVLNQHGILSELRLSLICFELTIIVNLGHCVPGLVVYIKKEIKNNLQWTGFEPKLSDLWERLLSASLQKVSLPT